MMDSDDPRLESILLTQVLELEKALRTLETRGTKTTAGGSNRRAPLVLMPLDGDDIAEQRMLDQLTALRLATRALTDGASPEPATDAARRSIQRLPDSDPFVTLLRDVSAHRTARP
ncbi:MAG: hypothetical protein KDK01_11205 [Rhodobacteraceae bacterium]|jgi:hypothetical protein|nr:hypothetical protein [Paracoccaceae bacterium]